jgi:PAS domain S-box-containing protein
MTAVSLFQRISALSRRLEELQAKYASNPANARDFSDALESLHASLDDLLDAEKMLKQNNDECIKSAKESTDSQALVHQLQVHQIELEMQNEELKRAKLEVESALTKYSDLYDFSPVGLFTLDEQGQILEANLAGATLLGLARGSLINNSFRQFVAPKYRQSFDDFCKSAFETSTKQTCELRLIGNDGSTICVDVDGIANEDKLLNRKQLRIDVIDITDRKHAEEALRESKEQLAFDMAAMTCLQKVSTSFMQEGDLNSLLDDIMEAAILAAEADKGTLQLIRPDSEALEIVAQCGFDQSFIDFFSSVSHGSAAVCAAAFQKGERVIVEDVMASPIFVGTPALDMQLTAGVRAVQSTPLINRRGEMIGVLSTHWSKPQRPDGNILRYIDLLARQAADIIERKQLEELAKIDEKRLLSIIKISQHNPKSVKELLDYALDEAVALSESKLAYIVYYDENKRECIIHAWSKEVMKECSITNMPTVFQLDNAGIWGEAIRQRRPIVINDFLAPNPLKKGYPEGHAHLIRFMTVPVFIEDRIVAAVAVANKATDYSDQDVHQLTMLMDSVWAIAERKQAEEALQESEARFRSVLENSLDAAYRRNLLIDRYDYMSPVIEQITGYSAQEMDEMSIDEVLGRIHPDDRSQVEAGLEYGINAGWGIIEYRFKGKNGQYRSLADHFTVIKDKEGRPTFRGGIVRDITDRKKVEEELHKAHNELELRVAERTSELVKANEDLLKAKEEAEAAVEAKAAFLANMSHELRTPLNAVIGFSSLLLNDDLTADQKENIESIKKGGEALLAIISEILEFSRAEKEKITLEHQPFSLKHCIEESLDMVAVQAEEKGLNLSYTNSYGTPDIITGDPGRLRQVLINLLNNAVKFTDKGDVSLSISSMALDSNKHQITFEVKDTGIGMPQDKMDRIFEPFTQLEYVMSRKRDGAGLGLAISKKLVELMGGEISAESAEGRGSTFRFTIQAESVPCERLDLGEKRRGEYKKLSVEKPLSILVAEDNPSNQKVLVEMLKRLGYRPDAVADGSEVIQALVIRHYDVIFMDVKMPEMDGISAAKEIRKFWPDNGPTIVAITAYAMEGDQKMCLDAGMDGYIAKPVKLGDLAEVINKYQPRENY